MVRNMVRTVVDASLIGCIGKHKQTEARGSILYPNNFRFLWLVTFYNTAELLEMIMTISFSIQH